MKISRNFVENAIATTKLFNEHSDVIELLEAFDDLDSAAQRVLTALPSQMTHAAERLELERVRMRVALQKYSMNLVKKKD